MSESLVAATPALALAGGCGSAWASASGCHRSAVVLGGSGARFSTMSPHTAKAVSEWEQAGAADDSGERSGPCFHTPYVSVPWAPGTALHCRCGTRGTRTCTQWHHDGVEG
eukprot:3831751-Rhodomonas_salina.1